MLLQKAGNDILLLRTAIVVPTAATSRSETSEQVWHRKWVVWSNKRYESWGLTLDKETKKLYLNSCSSLASNRDQTGRSIPSYCCSAAPAWRWCVGLARLGYSYHQTMVCRCYLHWKNPLVTVGSQTRSRHYCKADSDSSHNLSQLMLGRCWARAIIERK